MTQQQRDIKRKLVVLQHAQESGNVALTARRFGISRQCHYKWKHAREQHGEAGRKVACLCALPEVCIEVSQLIRVTSGQRGLGDDWTSHDESVIGFGKAQIVVMRSTSARVCRRSWLSTRGSMTGTPLRTTLPS